MTHPGPELAEYVDGTLTASPPHGSTSTSGPAPPAARGRLALAAGRLGGDPEPAPPPPGLADVAIAEAAGESRSSAARGIRPSRDLASHRPRPTTPRWLAIAGAAAVIALVALIVPKLGQPGSSPASMAAGAADTAQPAASTVEVQHVDYGTRLPGRVRGRLRQRGRGTGWSPRRPSRARPPPPARSPRSPARMRRRSSYPNAFPPPHAVSTGLRQSGRHPDPGDPRSLRGTTRIPGRLPPEPRRRPRAQRRPGRGGLGPRLRSPRHGTVPAALSLGNRRAFCLWEDAAAMTEQLRNVIVIGSGPAGYTAALYAARANLRAARPEGLDAGGQLMLTTDVENYPGFADGIMGPELMEQMEKQAAALRRRDPAPATSPRSTCPTARSASGPATRPGAPQTLIIATGATARWLGVPGEERLRGPRRLAPAPPATASSSGTASSSSSAAATPRWRRRRSSRSSRRKVTIVHRRDEFRASKIMQDRALAQPEDRGPRGTPSSRRSSATSARRPACVCATRQDRRDDASCRPTACSSRSGTTRTPRCSSGQLETRRRAATSSCRSRATATNVPGVFAAGDVADHDLPSGGHGRGPGVQGGDRRGAAPRRGAAHARE